MQSKERNSSISSNSGNLAKQEIQIPVPWGHISGKNLKKNLITFLVNVHIYFFFHIKYQ